MSKNKTVKDQSNNKRSAIFIILGILGFIAIIATQVLTRMMYLSDIEYEIYYAETVDAFYNPAYIGENGLIFSNYFSVNGLYLVLMSVCFKIFGNIREVIIYYNIVLELLALILIYFALKNIFNRVVAFIISIVVALYPLIMFMIGDYTGTVYMLLWRSDRLLYFAGAIVLLLLSLIVHAIKKAYKRKKAAKLAENGEASDEKSAETEDSDIINLDKVNVEDIPEAAPEAPAVAESAPAPATEATTPEDDFSIVPEEGAFDDSLPKPTPDPDEPEPALAQPAQATTEAVNATPAPAAEQPVAPVSREEYIAANGVNAADYISTPQQEAPKKKDPSEYRVVISGLNMLFENPYSNEIEYLHKPAPSPEAIANMNNEEYPTYNNNPQAYQTPKQDNSKSDKQNDKVDLLINPLPVPKKHEPKNLDYDYDFDDADLKYDLDIDDNAEFDYE